MNPSSARGSVIIPAHDESSTIGPCLQALADQPEARDIDVVVVANGCSDDTVAVANGFDDHFRNLLVVDRPQPGKVGALNFGDSVTDAFPRIYLDADIQLRPGALGGLLDALHVPAPRAAAPSVKFDLSRCGAGVRLYYSVFRRLPYVTDRLVGLGVYGLSAAGRERFGAFPDLTADDLYIQRLFAHQERMVTPGEFVVRPPRSLRDLVAVRTRVARGNAELPQAVGPDTEVGGSSTRSTLRSLVGILLREPSMVVAVAIYVSVTMVARLRATRTTARWLRDESSRQPAEDQIVDVDGVDVTSMTQDDVVRTVMGALNLGRGGTIITPNVDILRQLREPDHKPLADAADIVVADGMPLVWASRIQGTPLPERVAGADLVWSLSKAAAERGRTVYLLGGAARVAERAGHALALAAPELQVVGALAPPFGFMDDPDELEAVIATVIGARPDLVFIALGFPRQEKMAALLRPGLPSTWFLGCGGALDMAAGDVARAPALLQSFGGEWMHRLVKEPRRLFRRYVVDDIPYSIGLMNRAVARRRRSS